MYPRIPFCVHSFLYYSLIDFNGMIEIKLDCVSTLLNVLYWSPASLENVSLYLDLMTYLLL